MKALSKNPLERFSKCVALIDSLRAALEGYEDAQHILQDIQEEESLWNRVSASRLIFGAEG